MNKRNPHHKKRGEKEKNTWRGRGSRMEREGKRVGGCPGREEEGLFERSWKGEKLVNKKKKKKTRSNNN